MRRESAKYLSDIQGAVLRLQELTSEKSFTDYKRQTMLRSAVEREFIVIGEAVSRLAKVDEPSVARIAGYERIIAFRNVLVHGYDIVDDRLVWGVLVANLPTLAQQVNNFWRTHSRRTRATHSTTGQPSEAFPGILSRTPRTQYAVKPSKLGAIPKRSTPMHNPYLKPLIGQPIRLHLKTHLRHPLRLPPRPLTPSRLRPPHHPSVIPANAGIQGPPNLEPAPTLAGHPTSG